MSNKIKNIIFDFGGVILNIDPRLTEAAFERLGISGVFKRYSALPSENYFDLFECGLISPQEFHERLCNDFSTSIDFKEFEKAWNALLLDLPFERISFLGTINKRYRSFMLSNTNEVHVTAFNKYINDTHGIPDMSPLFEKVFYSCRLEARKPNRDIFDKVLAETGVRAEETLFIDDTKSNLRGAEEAGLKVLHLSSGMELVKDLAYLLDE